MKSDYNKYELTRQQTRGLLLLLAASAITLGIAIWRSYRPTAEQEPVPQDAIEMFNHISAYSDTTSAATSANKPEKQSKRGKSVRQSSSEQKHKQSGTNRPQRDITTENL